ncbi:MAG TPA: SRPBCC domain-containing protein [Pedobacter sp.]|uniref:SRPBCC domain-containing protein n=1 Tax=Pedobacter sp. TaxID=1411316 RepID=UPI002BBAB46E|nr:SRPBCC domain-containing protein [Pedobacter sp.]HMI04688.1 SRPBCC domain-containing protein [Pedobacter sp.]
MKGQLIAETSVTIKATPQQVWKAITTPSSIEKYLMGTHAISDWKEGSPITYEDEYNGKKYHDKGTIRKFEPGKLFQSTYWSSMGGKKDEPEKEKEHATNNWKAVLQKLKEVVEE